MEKNYNADAEFINNLDGMSDEEINLLMYDGDKDFMNLDQELIEYLCKGRDVFEDMREEIENSRTYTTPETRHKVEGKLKLVTEICELIEQLWDI